MTRRGRPIADVIKEIGLDPNTSGRGFTDLTLVFIKEELSPVGFDSDNLEPDFYGNLASKFLVAKVDLHRPILESATNLRWPEDEDVLIARTAEILQRQWGFQIERYKMQHSTKPPQKRSKRVPVSTTDDSTLRTPQALRPKDMANGHIAGQDYKGNVVELLSSNRPKHVEEMSYTTSVGDLSTRHSPTRYQAEYPRWTHVNQMSSTTGQGFDGPRHAELSTQGFENASGNSDQRNEQDSQRMNAQSRLEAPSPTMWQNRTSGRDRADETDISGRLQRGDSSSSQQHPAMQPPRSHPSFTTRETSSSQQTVISDTVHVQQFQAVNSRQSPQLSSTFALSARLESQTLDSTLGLTPAQAQTYARTILEQAKQYRERGIRESGTDVKASLMYMELAGLLMLLREDIIEYLEFNSKHYS